MTTPKIRRLLDAALAYAAAGLPVVPLHTPVTPPGPACSCRNPDCDRPGKHPRTRHGLHDATTDPEQIRAWWLRWPAANIGLLTGVACDVADVDDQAGVEALRPLLGELAGRVPLARTGSGGWHVYLAPTGAGNRAQGPGFLPGVDWRGRRGYVVAPPSLHASGRRYAWVRPLVFPIPAAPERLLRLVLREHQRWPTGPVRVRVSAGSYAAAALRREADAVRACPPGRPGRPGRNCRLNTAAFNLGQLVAAGLLDESEVVQALTDAALDAGLGEAEAARAITSGLAAGKARPRDLAHVRRAS